QLNRAVITVYVLVIVAEAGRKSRKTGSGAGRSARGGQLAGLPGLGDGRAGLSPHGIRRGDPLPDVRPVRRAVGRIDARRRGRTSRSVRPFVLRPSTTPAAVDGKVKVSSGMELQANPPDIGAATTEVLG